MYKPLLRIFMNLKTKREKNIWGWGGQRVYYKYNTIINDVGFIIYAIINDSVGFMIHVIVNESA